MKIKIDGKVLAVVLAAIFLLLNIPHGCKSNKEAVRVPNRLNEYLTNEMSDTSALSRVDREIDKYMSYWCMKGVQLSIMKNDSLVYSKGYGWADEEKGEEMTPGTIMRVASVSKLITAAGLMLLCDRNQLSLDEKVFGPEGILNDEEFTAAIKDTNYFNITVEHLLRHQGGFVVGSRGDPMFSTPVVMRLNDLKEAPDHNTLVRTQLRYRLNFKPGTSASYSNFGYLLLSMIIERKTGEDYEKWMQKNLLEPAGCYDMHLAHNYYREKRKNETRYHVQVDEPLVEEYNHSGDSVVRCYGGNDIHALAGAGAWVASSAELARFVASIDGRPEVPDVLSESSIGRMTEYINDKTYALGWNECNERGEWIRTGTLSGTSAMIKYFPDGECWIFISNTSTWKGPKLARYTAELFNKCRSKSSDLLPARDFFYE